MDPEAGRTIGSVMARTFWSIARVIAVCYAVIVIYALLASERMIFQPPAARNVQDRVTAIESRDGERIGFFSDVTDTHRMTILFSHGNAEDLSTVPGFLEELSAMGFNTASYDYRGYGISDGTPSVKKGYKDAEAAYPKFDSYATKIADLLRNSVTDPRFSPLHFGSFSVWSGFSDPYGQEGRT